MHPLASRPDTNRKVPRPIIPPSRANCKARRIYISAMPVRRRLTRAPTMDSLNWGLRRQKARACSQDRPADASERPLRPSIREPAGRRTGKLSGHAILGSHRRIRASSAIVGQRYGLSHAVGSLCPADSSGWRRIVGRRRWRCDRRDPRIQTTVGCPRRGAAGWGTDGGYPEQRRRAHPGVIGGADGVRGSPGAAVRCRDHA
jgi:hypothetical protein